MKTKLAKENMVLNNKILNLNSDRAKSSKTLKADLIKALDEIKLKNKRIVEQGNNLGELRFEYSELKMEMSELNSYNENLKHRVFYIELRCIAKYMYSQHKEILSFEEIKQKVLFSVDDELILKIINYYDPLIAMKDDGNSKQYLALKEGESVQSLFNYNY
ncbi:hypothetical protein [Winogradskyella bathintestinalis]|uniref:Uncharacterized protein n=1 Tax=Winogradskyella bathintestinalis TaxID=3035208 RepID=A0ABT7ZXH9_9FLAO|nr:hypothetical protein [Winogradskyella bathintestinalis]MDN3493715.1 hypothetical protein [Winogradskyella bathintestinalis]